MESLIQDIRYGIRLLAGKPGFTAVAAIALALGIGANTAIFSVVNKVLLNPLPYKDPDRIMMVWEENAKSGYPIDTPSPANFISWKEQNQVFEDMAAFDDATFSLTGGGEPEKITGDLVSASFFPILGVDPIFGRVFSPEEDVPGANRVVIISHGIWQRRFGSDREILGKTLTLDGQSYSVIGVMPPQFEFLGRGSELWVPIAFTQEEAAARGNHYLEVIARTRPGVTREQAQADMSLIAERLQQEFPLTNTSVGAVVIPLHEQIVGDIRPALLILMGAVGFVLLIACANVANLLLARAAVRQKETAIRTALGAGRARLVRQFLTESVLLSGLGGVLGLVISIVGVKVLVSFVPDSISQAKEVTLDAKVLLFTFGISMLTGVIFGLIPALQASRPNLNETLKEGGRDSSAGASGSRARNILVVSEIGLALVLLIGAGLMINSFLKLLSVDPGFRTDSMLTAKIILPDSKYPGRIERAAFFRQLLERVGSLPGVEAAGLTTSLPLTSKGNSLGIAVEGRPEPPPDEVPIIVTRVINPDYFRTMSIPLLQGRIFSEQDSENAPFVVIIDEAMARKLWPDEDPIGRRIKMGGYNSTSPWRSVVGVVKEVRQFELDAAPRPQMYVPFPQTGVFAPQDLVLRTSGDPLSMVSAVRSEVWAIDKDQPISTVRTMEDIMAASVAKQRFNMLLLGIFAVVALVLAAVGIYGVMSYLVTQRTREIGLRMALGAQRSDVLKLVVGQGFKLVAIGVALGLFASFALTRYMSSLLFGVSTTDPVTFVVISVTLIAIALLASYIPARRATQIDPMRALHYE
ncbi:MAG TPA: ABC transporter permease [Blastocatellia bacterium]|nr:ABC transporter permease [Blastocatellia bacterium]